MTDYLVDTHALLWWAESPARLSEAARLAIGSGRNRLHASYATVWEIHLKILRGKLRLPESTSQLIERARCHPLPIALPHIEATSQLPLHHRDPFDRLLVSQARCEKLVLITNDVEIQKYAVPVLVA